MKVLKLVIAALIFVFLYPFIAYWVSYAGGMIVQLVIGEQVCESLNMLFNTTRFVPEMLPKISAGLGFIGGFFQGVSNAVKGE